MFVISLTGNEFMVCICNVICLSSHWQGMNSWYIYAMSYMFVISLTRNEFMVYICNVIICLSSHWQGKHSWYISVLSYVWHLTDMELIYGIFMQCHMFVISLTGNEFMVYICNVIICLSSHWQGMNSWYISVMSYVCHLTDGEWIHGIYL